MRAPNDRQFPFRRRAAQCPGLLITILLLSGCGGDGMPRLVNVTGTVTIDGDPVTDATLIFQPVEVKTEGYGRPSYAFTDAAGRFTPWTMKEGDGIPIGRYRLGVDAKKQVGGPEITENITPAQYARVKWERQVPQKYEDPATSELTVEITASGIIPEIIELTSNGKPSS